MSKMKLTLGYMAALLLFTACTQDETGTLPDGTQPLKLTAAIGGEVATRTTADGTWEEEDAITLSIDANTYTYQYEGTDWTSSAPYFWQAEDDAIFVSAYSFSGEATGAYAVQADQSTDEGYLSGDLLYAPAVEVTYGEEAELTFYHQTAKVVVNLKKEGIMAENPAHGVAIQGVLSGTFTAPTGEETYGTWTTNLTESSSITPQAITPTDEYAASYQALLIPQTIDDAFISITIGGETYHYTPEPQTTLQPGHVYTYNITVFSYGLEVQVTESIDWNTTNTGNGNLTLEDHYDEATKTYYAYTADGLKKWAEKARTDLTVSCILMDDIDYNDKEWTAIGAGNTSIDSYSGTFDGGGHTIRNITIKDNAQNNGLFGYIAGGGTVKNLTVKNASMTTSRTKYGIIAAWNDGTIENCVVSSCDITGSSGYVGCISYQNFGRISCCRVDDANVSCGSFGGIVWLNNGRIEASSFQGHINADGGALVETNSIIGGTIIACWTNATHEEGKTVAGIVRYLDGGSVTACYYGGDMDAGILDDRTGIGDATKVDGNPYTWIDAADFMNYELGSDFGWYWQDNGPSTPPTLVEVDN